MEADMATQPMRPPQKPRTAQSIFGDLPPAIVRELETISLTNHYPTGAVLFSEGMAPRGVYLVQSGLVELSVCASDGRTRILRIAQAGEALGVASTIGSRDYEATAKPQQPADLTFIRQSHELRMMRLQAKYGP